MLYSSKAMPNNSTEGDKSRENIIEREAGEQRMELGC